MLASEHFYLLNKISLMLTFNLALKHLDLIDFSGWNLKGEKLEDSYSEKFKNDLMIYHTCFENDKENNKSNSYYRNMVFQTACLHLIFKACGVVSFWDVALEIIESNKSILDSNYEGFSPGSIYPKLMVDQWNKYCEDLNKKGIHLLNGENNLEYFMAAFHYYKKDN